MTIEQRLLIQIYATQKVYLTRTLEMVCALQEQLETNEEPTGVLFQVANEDTVQVVKSLVDQLRESLPIYSPLIKEDVSDEVLEMWLDTAVDRIMNEQDPEDDNLDDE